MNVQNKWFGMLLIGIIFIGTCENKKEAQTMHVEQPQDQNQLKREEMVEEQVIARGVRDKKVIAAMQTVPRHEFVPSNYRDMAYQDSPLPIGYEQTISQPYIVAYMSEILKLTETDTVLEIGTGSGYQAAVLAEIVSHVYTIEIVPELGKMAAEVLKKLEYDNVTVKVGDGYQGWSEYAPFDAVILTAAPPKIPKPLLDQLENGGRLIAPVGKQFQELVLFTKEREKIKRDRLIPVRFVPMTGEAQKKK